MVLKLGMVWVSNANCKYFFFTDGYFDFDKKVWRSSGEFIEESNWFIPKESLDYLNHYDHRTYPTMNDRIAYVKDEFY